MKVIIEPGFSIKTAQMEVNRRAQVNGEMPRISRKEFKALDTALQAIAELDGTHSTFEILRMLSSKAQEMDALCMVDFRITNTSVEIRMNDVYAGVTLYTVDHNHIIVAAPRSQY